MNTITDMTTMLRRARASTLLASVQQRGTLTLTATELAAWGQRGWTPAQIIAAAHDLAGEGAVRLITDTDGTRTITATGVRNGR